MEKVVELCKKYNITPICNNNMHGDATGIGDILLRIMCMKNKLINTPFNINLTYFTTPYYDCDPINQLEFRLRLITDLLHFNNIPKEMINFIFSNNLYLNQHFPYKAINNFHLNIGFDGVNTNTEEYIIFHTKCRHTSRENYTLLKQKIKTFCSNFKTSYKIIIMGERLFPRTYEVDVHGITTVYTELLELKNNNNIVDVTSEMIYTNLNYDNYKNDVKLITSAKCNICFGQGGQLCTSLIFGKSVIFYYTVYDFDKINLQNNHHFQCSDTDVFLNLVQEKCSNSKSMLKIKPHVGGFLSMFTVRLRSIISFINENGVAPNVDSSEQFGNLKTENIDITDRFITSKNVEIPNKIVYSSSKDEDQFSDYKLIKYPEINTIIERYFTISLEVCKTILDFNSKYNIDYQNTCGVFYRGNDKNVETNPPKYEDFILKAKEIQNNNPNIKFFVQTDELDFLQAFKKEFECITINELIAVNRFNGSVSSLLPQNEKIDYHIRFLAVIYMMSKMNTLIMTSGSCGMWICLYRGNANNVHQYLNTIEYMYNVKNPSYDPNKTDFWL